MSIFQVLLITALSWVWVCFLALPVWLIWTVGGVGTRYFGFQPTPWQSVPLLHVVGLLLLFTIFQGVISGLRSQMNA